ncbi:MAG: DUF3500 domain-containing protein [Actinobacteria bacterium]|nr:DUF3500 domain-containing protein [Actinomycetota bacterium]MBW3650746.1 DUF3500 domain-containing protein [Actinomycetota bacterium]
MSYAEAVARMARAASAFLASTGPAPHPAAAQRFDDEEVRRDWHYIPRERGGLPLSAMTSSQEKAAYDLLASGLSVPTFAAATTVIGLEDVLDEVEGKRPPFRPRRGRRPAWGRHRADYSVTVFGDPEAEEPWGWRFEGHHLSVNVTVVGGVVAPTPLFVGANPAEVLGPSGHPVTRPLAAEEELALALVEALPPALRAEAVVSAVPPDDILTGAEPLLIDPPEPEGVVIAKLSGRALGLAHDLLSLYVNRSPAPVALRRWQALEEDLGDVTFAFAGEPARRRPHYYRLQGPGLLVEYDNTQDGANHIHTVVRDPEGDFGDDLLRAHRARHHRSA